MELEKSVIGPGKAMAKEKTKNDIRTGPLTEMHPLPRRFEEVKENGEGKGIFYFHVPGDYLHGILLSKQTVQTLHYPFTSFLIKAFDGRQDGIDLVIPEKGQVFEIPANWLPRRIIDDNELIGSLIVVKYKGKKGQKKDYYIWKDTGTFYKNESRQLPKIHKKRKKEE